MRTRVSLVFCMSVVLAAGCSAGGSTTSTEPTSSVGSRAQPTARVEQISQGDPCAVNGATAVNQQGRAFDCEPSSDGVLRWIIP
jgi:endonuclease YncB( thermonuclease family)